MIELDESQTRFVELMQALFQLDEAEGLDFGIYRIIRHRNRAVRDFLGEIVETGKGTRALQGGELQQILDTSFSEVDQEQQLQVESRLRETEQSLGIGVHAAPEARSAALDAARKIPLLATRLDEYEALLVERDAGRRGSTDRLEVLNRLLEFFGRHYQDGDFIVERRYGKDGATYIRSTGDDVEFRWATEDMYYIKSGDLFSDFRVRLANGATIILAVSPESVFATRAALKPNDKTHYVLANIECDGGAWRVLLDYRKGARSNRIDQAITDAVVRKTGADAGDVSRWFRRFVARNQSDFFIHKRLAESLNESLDVFLKTEVLDADLLLAEGSAGLKHARVARQVRSIARRIIAFIGALEDFQKQLWEKKKLVLDARYIITLDRVAALAGEAWLQARLADITQRHEQEWRSLGLGEYKTEDSCRKGERWLPLPVDTGLMGAAFKWALLAQVSEQHAIDDVLDGNLLHGENWQVLNLAQLRWQSKVDCVYIDPPYNAKGTSEIPYKNAYRHSSWLAMMRDRLTGSRPLLTPKGVVEVAIDENEGSNLEQLLKRHFPNRDIVGVAVQHNRRGIQGDNFAFSSEWMYVVHPPGKGVLREIPRDEAEYSKDNLRNWGDESDRTDAKNCFYPIYVSAEGQITGFGDVAADEFHPARRTVRREATNDFAVWPIDKSGNEKKWRYARDSIESIRDLISADFVADDDIEIKKLKVSDRPKTLWDKKSYHAGDYGTKVLTSLFGKEIRKLFQFPKSLNLVMDAVQVASPDDGLVFDYFGGSGTTAHAVMELRRIGRGQRKFAVCEVNHYFDSVVVPRVKKVAASGDWQTWRNGSVSKLDGAGIFVRVSKLESYDDTLESLETPAQAGDALKMQFIPTATSLRWTLDADARRVFCNVERFRSPFGYTLTSANAAGNEQVDVDLVESLQWLLGLHVVSVRKDDEGVLVTGRGPNEERIVVAFRDCDAPGSAAWVDRVTQEAEFDRALTNDVAGLAFPGVERIESIEGIFATQFGGKLQ